MQFYGFAPDFVLRAALDAVADGRYADARAAAAKHANALVPALIDWLIARQPNSGMSASKIIAVLASHRGWPEPETLQLRAEQAFHAFGPKRRFGARPSTVRSSRSRSAGGWRSPARFATPGRTRGSDGDRARAVARLVARTEPGGGAADPLRRGADEGGPSLPLPPPRAAPPQPRTRSRRRSFSAPATTSWRAPSSPCSTGEEDARQLLRGVAPEFLADPLYVFARVHLLLRVGSADRGGAVPARLAARHGSLGRRRHLVGGAAGSFARAARSRHARPRLSRSSRMRGPRAKATASRRRFMPAGMRCASSTIRSRAEPHFRELHILATLPRTQARASYWLGRTHEAEGRDAAARLDYVEAARFGGTFYGQLAREKLGITTTGLERMPRPSALDRLRFADRDLVKVVRLLAAAGYADRSLPFLRALGESVDTPGEVALLTDACAAHRPAAGRHRRRGGRRGARPEGRLTAGALLRRAGGPSAARRGRPRARLCHRPPGERLRPHGGQPCRRARPDAAHAGDRAGDGAKRPDSLLRAAAHHRPALQRHAGRASSGRAARRAATAPTS